MKSDDLVAVDCNLCGNPAVNQKDLIQAPLQRKIRSHFNDLKQTSFKICPNCGLVFLSPRPPEERFLAYYRSVNHKPKQHEEIIRNEEANSWYHHEVMAFLEQHLNLATGARICDVGCGYGSLLHLLKERYQGGTVGVELSTEAAAFASAHYKLDIQQGRLDDVINSESFDLLVSVAVVEHLIDPLKSLRQMAELVKPGGHLLIIVPDLESLNLSPHKGERLQTVFKIVHLYYFTYKTLAAMLVRVGLTPIKNRKFSRIKKQGELWLLARKGGDAQCSADLTPNWRELQRYVRRKTFWPRVVALLERIGLTIMSDKMAQQIHRYLVGKK